MSREIIHHLTNNLLVYGTINNWFRSSWNPGVVWGPTELFGLYWQICYSTVKLLFISMLMHINFSLIYIQDITKLYIRLFIFNRYQIGVCVDTVFSPKYTYSWSIQTDYNPSYWTQKHHPLLQQQCMKYCSWECLYTRNWFSGTRAIAQIPRCGEIILYDMGNVPLLPLLLFSSTILL